MVDSRLFNCIQSPSQCLSHLFPPEKHYLGLRPTVMHSLYAQITFVNDLLVPLPDVYFVFFNHLVVFPITISAFVSYYT